MNKNQKPKILIFILLLTVVVLTLNASDTINDDDNDMIPNKYDKCPNTSDGVCVNKDGCIQQIKRVVYFDSESYGINSNSKTTVNDILEISSECFGYDIYITGHTDSIYNAKYNLNLSKKRAIAIYNLLIKNNIDKKRIKIEWYGEVEPITTNITNSGRAINRRVELLFK